MTRAVLIAIHDVAPATLEECRALAQWIHALDPCAPMTLLCVPHYHAGTLLEESVACRRWIDACITRGAEVALHGYRHRDDGPEPITAREWLQRRVLTQSEGEFATLNVRHARERIQQGLAMFQRCGWNVAGFVPPAWLMSRQVVPALRALALDYCTDGAGFHRIGTAEHLRVPVIGTSARSGWRRIASRAWLAARVRGLAATDCVRVALHPEDARHADMRAAWQSVLETLLASRQPFTKHSWLSAQSKSAGNARSR